MTIQQAPDSEPVPRAAVLAEADRIVRRSALELAWLRWHGRAQYELGWADGYERAEADLEHAWHELADPVAHGRSPLAEGWQRRVSAAESYSRRAAADHWRDWWRRAPAEAAAAEQLAAKLRKEGRHEEADGVLASAVVVRAGAAYLAARRRGDVA